MFEEDEHGNSENSDNGGYLSGSQRRACGSGAELQGDGKPGKQGDLCLRAVGAGVDDSRAEPVYAGADADLRDG